MVAKILSITVLVLTGFHTLSAQIPVAALHHAGENSDHITGLVSQLGQNALLLLLGVIALVGLVWIVYICNACTGINRKQKSSLLLWFSVVAGISVFSSSCTVVQQVRTAESQAKQTTTDSYCTCHAPLSNLPFNGNPGMYNPYPYNQYPYNMSSIGTGKPFCGQCGKRIHNNK